MTASVFPNDLLTLRDWSDAQIRTILEGGHVLRHGYAAADRVLAGRAMAMLFEKPSLRTRVSFEIGMQRLGGSVVFLDHRGERIGARESVEDYARNLERWVDVLVLRTFRHDTIERMAEIADIPVINALSESFHPCQALADALTLESRLGSLVGRRVAWIGDGNNVCHSLMIVLSALGCSTVVITPPSDAPDQAVVDHAAARAAANGATVTLSSDPALVAGCDAVYTDTWTSMGEESEHTARTARFSPYRVTEQLMGHAGDDALFMHCLPAHRGEEVTDEVIDGARSIVYDQAENRMHAQCAVLLALLAPAALRSLTAPGTAASPDIVPAITTRPVRARTLHVAAG
ncbi:MAG: ornithine carbamoyltransferase [Phycisphaeraceae bacterium]|nr:ornithine carbamoyltransferase [Phycisphaeraceae bacterium]